jgi:hypothetical protein
MASRLARVLVHHEVVAVKHSSGYAESVRPQDMSGCPEARLFDWLDLGGCACASAPRAGETREQGGEREKDRQATRQPQRLVA